MKKKGAGIVNGAIGAQEGARLLTYKATGKYDVKSPYCRVYKAIYPELLKLEGLRLFPYQTIQQQ